MLFWFLTISIASLIVLEKKKGEFDTIEQLSNKIWRPVV